MTSAFLYLHIENHPIEVWPDHIHMLLDIPPKITVSSFLGYTPGFAEGYLFVRFLGLLLLLFQPFSHLFIRRRHSAELAANSTVPAKTLSFHIPAPFYAYRFCSIAHYDPVCKCVAGQFCRTVQYITEFVENFTFSADFCDHFSLWF